MIHNSTADPNARAVWTLAGQTGIFVEISDPRKSIPYAWRFCSSHGAELLAGLA